MVDFSIIPTFKEVDEAHANYLEGLEQRNDARLKKFLNEIVDSILNPNDKTVGRPIFLYGSFYSEEDEITYQEAKLIASEFKKRGYEVEEEPPRNSKGHWRFIINPFGRKEKS